jgi:cytochrome c oxidase subunit 2
VDSSLTSPGTTPTKLPSDLPPEASSGTAAPARAGRSRRRRLGAALALVVGAVLLAGCNVPTFGEYKGATTQGRDEEHLWQLFFIAGLVVGGIVLLLILWAVFRYRRRSDAMPKQTQYHTLLEIAYTIVPVVIVVALFVFTVLSENRVDATPPNPGAAITVHAFQWGWEFEYPGGSGSGCADPSSSKANQNDCVKIIGQTTQNPAMVVPTGTDVEITLSSLDVLHGFYVPAFNFSRYASPGYKTQFDFNVLHTGDYRGQCTQLCGLYHSLMFFNVHAVTQSQYTSWLHRQQAVVQENPGSQPKLPKGVSGGSATTNSPSTNLGGDLYGD